VDEPRGLVGVTNALVVLDLRTGEECRLVEVEGEMWGPLVWSPDGRQIAFDGPSGDRSYGAISTVDVATG
jgi:Tol biopolymer transport system component